MGGSLYVGDVLAAWAGRYVPHEAPASTLGELRDLNGTTARTGVRSTGR